MIRSILVASVVLAAAYQAGSMSSAKRSAPPPIITEQVDLGGARIQLPRAKLLDVPGATGRAHEINSLLNVPGRIR